MPLVSFLRKTSSFSKVCFQVTMYVARDIGIQILRYRSVFLEPDFFLTPENYSYLPVREILQLIRGQEIVYQ